MEIREKQVLEMKNVLSCRGAFNQAEVETVMKSMEAIIAENGAAKTGPTVSATFAVSQSDGMPVFDMEILIPVDKELVFTSETITFKPLFRLTNALVIRHVGNPNTMINTITALNSYITENKLTPITSAYNVTVKEARYPSEIDSMIVDVYVGVREEENIL